MDADFAKSLCDDISALCEMIQVQTLIKLFPYIQHDAEEKSNKLRDQRENEERTYARANGFRSIEHRYEFSDRLDEKYAPLLAEQNARVQRLRTLILLSAEKLWPDLKTQEKGKNHD